MWFNELFNKCSLTIEIVDYYPIACKHFFSTKLNELAECKIYVFSHNYRNNFNSNLIYKDENAKNDNTFVRNVLINL